MSVAEWELNIIWPCGKRGLRDAHAATHQANPSASTSARRSSLMMSYWYIVRSFEPRTKEHANRSNQQFFKYSNLTLSNVLRHSVAVRGGMFVSTSTTLAPQQETTVWAPSLKTLFFTPRVVTYYLNISAKFSQFFNKLNIDQSKAGTRQTF